MERWRQRLALMLLAGLLSLQTGCGAHNPSYFPHFSPFGSIIPTHAEPGGHSYWSNFDPHAIRLEVRPLEATNPVRTQHVLIATIYDEKNQPRRARRVEWNLQGVGTLITVDEAGHWLLGGRGYKESNTHGVSYTNYFEHTVDRGNENPNDDFVIRPGQTWCIIDSAVEGDTHVTVYAPEIHNWEKNKVYATIRWLDAFWQFPPPQT